MELRGSTFHPPTLDMLDEFAVVPAMIESGLKAPTWQFRDRETGPVATFDLSLLAGDTNHPYRVQCEQWKLMRLLRDAYLKIPGAEIKFGHTVTGVTPGDDSVAVTADTPGGPVTLDARYVVAADGARSAVRRSLGVEFEGFTYPELFLIASTAFRFEDTLTDIAYVNYIADPNEWLVLLRVPGLWRVLVPAPENADREQLLSDENLQQVLQRVVPRGADYDIEHRSIYHVHQRVAKSFRAGRVLLAGDAAHINNPLGGMGMNGGIHDAFNLVRQARRDLRRRRRGAARPLRAAAPHGRDRGGAAADQPQSPDLERARSGDAREVARRDAADRGRSGACPRVYAQILDDRRAAPRGRNPIAGIAMRDVLGWRKKFGVMGPSTNTVVQPDFDMMRPVGVTNHYSRIYTPNAQAVSNESFMAGATVIADNTLDAVRSVMTCAPDYLVMGMSAVTFFGGAAGADAFQAKIAREAGVGVSIGSHSCTAALKAYGGVKRIAFLTPYFPAANEQVAQILHRFGLHGGARHLPAVPELDRHRRSAAGGAARQD